MPGERLYRSSWVAFPSRRIGIGPTEPDGLLREIEPVRTRLSNLGEGGRRVSETLDVRVVLQEVIGNACYLTGARYGALLTYEPSGGIEGFITSGLSAEVIERLNTALQGLGLLGYMNEIRAPLRLTGYRQSSQFRRIPRRPPADEYLSRHVDPPSRRARRPKIIRLPKRLLGSTEPDQERPTVSRPTPHIEESLKTMRTLPLTNRGLHLSTIVTLVLLAVLAALLASTSAVFAQGGAPDTPDQPTATAVFIGGVDLEWNEVPGADSYDVQLYRNGQWIDLPGDGVEIAFYGAGAIISELDPTSSLWFHVRARNVHGISDWSEFNFMSSTNQHALGRRARPDNVVASGGPVINGTARVGETLSTDTTGIVDGNGLDRVQFLFQWVSNDGSTDTDIAGATDSTHTLVAADEGKTINVQVAFTDRGGYAESLIGEGTEEVASSEQANPAPTAEPAQNSPATGAPTITGTAQEGETLTADTSGITDADGLSGTTFSYQWVANDGNSDTDITGATGSTYSLAASDDGKALKVRVAFTDDAGFDETLTSAPTAAVAAAEPDEPPAQPQGLTGTVAYDAVSLTWDDPDDATITGYQILRRDTALHDIGDFQAHVDDTGSAAAAYVDKDVSPERRYVYRIKARNVAGLSVQSHYFRADTPSAPVQNSPATGTPIITGTAQVGETLTADTTGIADADGLSSVTFSYQWISNDGTTDTDIVGAAGSAYSLADSDDGKALKVRVSFTDDSNNEETLTSAATATVEAAPNSPGDGRAHHHRHSSGGGDADGGHYGHRRR